MKKVLKITIVLSMLFATASLSAKIRISPVVGVSAPIMTFDPLASDTAVVPGFGLAAGGIFTLDVIPIIKFDIGAVYKENKYSSVSSSATIEYTYGQLYVPLMVRAELAMFSIGLGGFYSTATGDNINYESGGTSGSYTYSQLNFKKNNYGLMGSIGLRFKLPVMPVGILIDTIYRVGAEDLSELSTKTITQHDIELLVGVSFYL